MLIGRGEFYSIASALTWAFGVILYHRLGTQLSPIRLNLIKNLLVLGMLIPLLFWYQAIAPMTTFTLTICLISGFIGIGFGDTLYFRALNLIGAGRMGIVGNLYSPFVIVLAFIFLDERLNFVQIIGFILVMSGVGLIGTQKEACQIRKKQLYLGLSYAIFSILLMAISIVMIKTTLAQHSVLWVCAIRMIGGIFGLLLMLYFSPPRAAAYPNLRISQIGLLVCAAFVGQLLSMIFWLTGYKYTSASVASVLNETASIFILFFAWLLLKEPLTRNKLLGTMLTISGVSCMLL